MSDDEQGVTLRIVEGVRFSDSGDCDALRSEILISSEFVSGRVELYLNAYDLDGWSEALDTLASGREVSWLESGRSPRIMIAPPETTESGCAEVSVYDVTGSQISVTVPVAAEPDWIERHRQLLAEAGGRFPLAR
ncbi:DUF5959 family protein [Streptomyces sp. L2]|uniref:DUF5959 family protein n=1 Tax=Streptomyces sp. L2 TaxID=2162665 RepID=UPI0010128913|nr:DUF5959 family protein [Streptomyces sp. L2]